MVLMIFEIGVIRILLSIKKRDNQKQFGSTIILRFTTIYIDVALVTIGLIKKKFMKIGSNYISAI